MFNHDTMQLFFLHNNSINHPLNKYTHIGKEKKSKLMVETILYES